MTIIHIIGSPDRGGTEVLALDLCRNAKINGLNLILVVTHKGVLDDEFRSSGAEYYYFPRRYPIDFSLIYKLKKVIEKKKVKVIHSHQAVDGLHAYLTSKLTKVKVILSFHGHVKSFKNDMVLKFLIPRVDANISVSKSFFLRLKQDIGFKIWRDFHIIYNGIDSKKFYKTSGNLKSELGLSDSYILLGMVGNFNDNIRDQITVCKALPSIFKEYNNIHFVFIGRRPVENPQYYNECYNFCQKNEILDRTHFIGPRTDINNILNSLDIFVYSSNYDTFGIAVIEAQMSGLPVVINDLPSLMEVTDNGKYAQVFKSKDEHDLQKKIFELLENKSYSHYLSYEGKNWSINNFNIEKYITNLKNLYKSII